MADRTRNATPAAEHRAPAAFHSTSGGTVWRGRLGHSVSGALRTPERRRQAVAIQRRAELGFLLACVFVPSARPGVFVATMASVDRSTRQTVPPERPEEKGSRQQGIKGSRDREGAVLGAMLTRSGAFVSVREPQNRPFAVCPAKRKHAPEDRDLRAVVQRVGPVVTSSTANSCFRYAEDMPPAVIDSAGLWPHAERSARLVGDVFSDGE